MKPDQLKSILAESVKQLTLLRDRIRANLANIADHEERYQKLTTQAASTRADAAELETASVVALQRRGLEPSDAVKQVDELSAKASELHEQISPIEQELNGLRSSVTVDRAELRDFVHQFNWDLRLFEQAQLAATVCSWVDTTALDVLHELTAGRFDNLFGSTIVAGIIDDREKSLSQIDAFADPLKKLLSIADDILKEPIPDLARNPAELPDSRSNRFIATLHARFFAAD